MVPFAVLFALLGCPARESPVVSLDCQATDAPVDWSDAAPVGVAAEALLAPFTDPTEVSAAWHTGATTSIAVAVSAALDRSPVLTTYAGADAAQCDDAFAIPLTASLTTADGAFDLAVDGVWFVDPSDPGGTPFAVAVAIDPGTDAPSWVPDPDLLDDGEIITRLWVRLGARADGSSTGVVEAEIQGEDAETAWDRSAPVLTW
jgi:hypothetical protein